MPTLPFHDFISYLTRQGFIIGVDHHLRLQTVLHAVGPECPPSELKYLLGPIFATNEKQQQQFYRAFDGYFAAFQPAGVKEEKPAEAEKRATPPEPLWGRKWPYILNSIMLVVLIALAVVVSDRSLRFDFFRQEPTPTPTPVATPTPAPEAGVAPLPDDGKEPGPAQQEPPDKTWYQRYGKLLRWLIMCTPLIVWGVTEGYRWNRRKLFLERRRGKKPPFVWPIRLNPPEPGFLKHERFYAAARLLRHRLKSDVVRLDIPQTVTRTLESGGFPQFHYQAVTRPPEYLILIDLPDYHDHDARFADSLIAALQHEGLFITRYFYTSNPRICFREPNAPGEYLADLHDKYSDCRLLLFGSGDEFLDPLSGALDSWTTLFSKWPDRVLLTPVPPSEWGLRELALAQEFLVLPASLDGLNAVTEQFESPSDNDLKRWVTGWQAAFPCPASDRNGSPDCRTYGIPELRTCLGEAAFQWLCACAVYPELHWDLTLYLGALPCMPEHLLSEENLRRLIRLPYFREGVMPDRLRLELLGHLDVNTARVIRQAIIKILEDDPPPDDSLAYETYSLNLVVQRWLLSRRSRKRRKELRNALKQVPASRVVRDYTLLRFLESEPVSPLHIPLPRRLHKIFYNKGVPVLGIRSGIRAALVLMVIGVGLLLPPPGPIARTEPLIVSDVEAADTFKLVSDTETYKDLGIEVWRPEKYILNDFEDRGEVVVDHAMGLMWQKSGSADYITYQEAQKYIEQLNQQKFAGYDDWRLPTIEELVSLLEPEKNEQGLYIDPIFDGTQWWCWSADLRQIKDEGSAESAWFVRFLHGFVYWDYLFNYFYVRAVRS